MSKGRIAIVIENSESCESSEETIIYLTPSIVKKKRVTKKELQLQEFYDTQPIHDIDHEGKCIHKSRDDMGTCIRCGEWQQTIHQHQSYFSGSQKLQSKSIRRDIDNFNISLDTKERADSIYAKLMEGGVKVNAKKKIIAFCLWKAEMELGRVPNANAIAGMVGLDQPKMFKAIQYYSSPSNSSYKGVSNYKNPILVVEEYAKNINCTELGIETLKNDYILAIETFPELAEQPPVSVALGLIHSYAKTNGVTFNKFDEFVEEYGRKLSTIEGIGNKILSIQNM